MPPAEGRLDRQSFRTIHRALVNAGIYLAESEAMFDALAPLRDAYEPYINTLSGRLSLTVPAWLPPERVKESWLTSPWDNPAGID